MPAENYPLPRFTSFPSTMKDADQMSIESDGEDAGPVSVSSPCATASLSRARRADTSSSGTYREDERAPSRGPDGDRYRISTRYQPQGESSNPFDADRELLEAIELGSERIIDALQITKVSFSVTNDAEFAIRCQQLFQDGWTSDIASTSMKGRHPRLSPACIIAIGLLQTCKLLRAALGQDEPGQNDLQFFYAYGHSEAKDLLQGILKPFDEDLHQRARHDTSAYPNSSGERPGTSSISARGGWTSRRNTRSLGKLIRGVGLSPTAMMSAVT
ncbi:hypothetical protein QFC20_006254 [Naganishia adeliensis]|uniref:Uncharacterized protein n=1 Tax=Naganishia adeliensis TaxID=92952 RepID=A0ACC2VE46_9TREE|nr:hypothetical protein QFC20_006254 [Naganishia adeliensis]